MTWAEYHHRNRGVYESPRKRVLRAAGLFLVPAGIVFPALAFAFIVFLDRDRTE